MQFFYIFSFALITGALASPTVKARDENTVLGYKDECAADGSLGYCDEGYYCKVNDTSDLNVCSGLTDRKINMLTFYTGGRLREHRQVLHKIGVTGGEVAKRIAGAKDDPTFLFAPAEIIAEYKVHNINRMKLENILHRVFATAQLDLEIPDRFGKPFLGFLTVLLLDSLAERPHIKFLNGVPFEFVGVGIGESPCCARFEGHDQTVWLSGCPQGKPGSTGVHRGELPLAPAFMLIDEWAD